MENGVSIFDSTSAKAANAAASASGSRRKRILAALGESSAGLAIFEVAEKLQVFDHQISGRFGELERDLLIEKTGERRIKPNTKCEAEVYRLRAARAPASGPPGCPPEACPPQVSCSPQAYPPTLILNEPPHGDQFYERGPIDSDTIPGMPYSRKVAAGADGVPSAGVLAAGARLFYRVAIVECEGCGRPLKLVREKVAGEEKKLWRCGTIGCQRTWHLMIAREPGGVEVLAMVMKYL